MKKHDETEPNGFYIVALDASSLVLEKASDNIVQYQWATEEEESLNVLVHKDGSHQMP
jgi:hypothetical protein